MKMLLTLYVLRTINLLRKFDAELCRKRINELIVSYLKSRGMNIRAIDAKEYISRLFRAPTENNIHLMCMPPREIVSFVFPNVLLFLKQSQEKIETRRKAKLTIFQFPTNYIKCFANSTLRKKLDYDGYFLVPGLISRTKKVARILNHSKSFSVNFIEPACHLRCNYKKIITRLLLLGKWISTMSSVRLKCWIMNLSRYRQSCS